MPIYFFFTRQRFLNFVVLDLDSLPLPVHQADVIDKFLLEIESVVFV